MTPKEQVESVSEGGERSKSPDDSHKEHSLEGGMVRPETIEAPVVGLENLTCLLKDRLHAPCLSSHLWARRCAVGI